MQDNSNTNHFKTLMDTHSDYCNFDGDSPNEYHDIWSKSSGYFIGQYMPYLAQKGFAHPMALASTCHPKSFFAMTREGVS